MLEQEKNAQVKGYSIGGKTGTSEDGVNTNKYVTSFVGVAPIEDPQIVLLVTCTIQQEKEDTKEVVLQLR